MQCPLYCPFCGENLSPAEHTNECRTESPKQFVIEWRQDGRIYRLSIHHTEVIEWTN